MSAQMIELLVLAAIAFLVISKLLSILGTTDEEDKTRKTRSFFGEPGGLKDVTGTAPESSNHNAGKVIEFPKKEYAGDDVTNAIISKIAEKIPDFDPEKFLRNSKKAVIMIIDALNKNDKASLEELVDKRFISAIESFSQDYKEINQDKIIASFKDSYSFGNSVYVKLLLKAPKFEESWVFTRNVNQTGPAWHLSNIEKQP